MVIGMLAESSVRNICCLVIAERTRRKRGGRGREERLESNRGMNAYRGGGAMIQGDTNHDVAWGRK